MHTTYKMIKVEKDFVSDEVLEKISNIKNKREKEQAVKDELERVLEEIKIEKAHVIETAAKFGAFLKTFAIIPINDAMGDYIEMQIKDEESKANPDRKQIEEPKSYCRAFKEERECIERTLGKLKRFFKFANNLQNILLYILFL